jgi:hypothetical protein
MVRARFGNAAGRPAVPAVGQGLAPGSTYGQRVGLPARRRGRVTEPALAGLAMRGRINQVSSIQAMADNVPRGSLT